MKKMFAACLLILASCGLEPAKRTVYRTIPSDPALTDMQKQYAQLAGTVAQISGLLNNDFSTCAASLDDLIEKICRIAQDANEEKRNILKSELLNTMSVLQSKVDSVTDNVGRSDQKVLDINDSLYGAGKDHTCVAALNCTAGSIAGRLKQAETDITALNNLTAAIQGTVNRTLEGVEIGTENLAAGPGYEMLTRKVDRTQINGYVDAQSTGLSVSNSGVSATSGSATITITTTAAHGLTVGQTVQLSGLTEGRGFSSGHLTGLFLVVTVPTTTTLTVVLSTTATSNGALGGNIGVVTPLAQRGAGTVWKTSDGEQSKVANGGKVPYNFLITGGTTVLTANPSAPLPTGWGGFAAPGAGFACYSKVSSTASAATIKLGGTNILCK